MIETVCAKFRKQNHPNNTLLLTWAAFLSHFRRPFCMTCLLLLALIVGYEFHPASAELRPQVVEALRMLPSQALLLLCYLDNDLVIIK